MVGRRWGLIAGLLLGAAAALEAPARAEVPRLELRYAVPEGADCPSDDEFREMVSARLGSAPWASGEGSDARGERAKKADDAPVRVAKVQVLGTSARLTGLMRLEERGQLIGERRFTPVGPCRELIETIAFALVVAVDPLRTAAAQPPPSPAPAPEPAPSPAPELGAESAAVARPPRPEIEFVPSLGIVGSVAAMPEVSFGLTVDLALRFPRFSLALEGRADLPRTAPLAMGGSVETALFVGGLIPCVRFGAGQGCVAARVGALRIKGEGLEEPRTATELYSSVGLRGGYELELSEGFALRLTAELNFVLTRITITDQGVAVPFRYWSTPLLNGDLGLALVLHL